MRRENPSSAANFWKIYLYKFLGEFYLIVPVLIPYYQSHGLSPSQVFPIQAAYTLSILVFEIPSGYLADIIGRRKTLILGAFFFPCGLFIYSVGTTFWAFILAELVLSIANSMRSGCDSALLYDSLAELKRKGEYKRFEGQAFFFTRLGASAASILGGVLALVALRLPFIVNIATGSLMIPLALLLVEPQRARLDGASPFHDILRISRWSFAQPRLRFFIAFHALLLSTGLVGLWAAFLYYQSLAISVGLFGVLFAVFQMASALGSKNAHRLEKPLGYARSLWMLVVIGIIFLGVGSLKSVALIPMIMLAAFLWGLSYPLILDGLNRLIPSETRATVLSVAHMAGSFAFVILSLVFGALVKRLSLPVAYRNLGVFFLVSSLLVLVYGRGIGALDIEEEVAR